MPHAQLTHLYWTRCGISKPQWAASALHQPSCRDPPASSWGDQLPTGRGQKLVVVVGALEPLEWQGGDPHLYPESSPSPLHPRLRRFPSWNREAMSNRASSMCCPSRWESWKEKRVTSRGREERGFCRLRNKRAGVPDSWVGGRRGLGTRTLGLWGRRGLGVWTQVVGEGGARGCWGFRLLGPEEGGGGACVHVCLTVFVLDFLLEMWKVIVSSPMKM